MRSNYPPKQQGDEIDTILWRGCHYIQEGIKELLASTRSTLTPLADNQHQTIQKELPYGDHAGVLAVQEGQCWGLLPGLPLHALEPGGC